MSKGCVYLVGAGPGDPGLITVRGRELLARADVVVYDYLVSPRLLACVKPGTELIYVGKQAGAHTLRQEQINELLAKRAAGGATVVRLKGGDPFVFGRGGEEALHLAEAGIPFEVVPGVTAGVAAAAYAGIPVTHRRLAGAVGLVTGHETPDKSQSDLDYQALADWPGTLVFYMGVANLPEICGELIGRGMDPKTPAAVIRWGTTPRQQVVAAPLGELADRVAAAGLKPPAVTVIGQAAALREKLNWFERRPLFGRRIVVTRARAQASALADRLTELGADVVELPMIRIAPPEDPGPLLEAVGRLDAFDWIVFTSANAVEAFFDALAAAKRDSRALARVRVCAVGPATAERLGQFGIRPDAQPETFRGATVCDALARAGATLNGARVLCPRADIAPKDLPEALAARGAAVTEVVAYRTLPEPVAPDFLEDLSAERIDWVTFTSSSTVKNFLAAVGAERLRAWNARLASIGPSTSETLRESGFPPTVEAATHTTDGLIEAILAWEAGRGRT